MFEIHTISRWDCPASKGETKPWRAECVNTAGERSEIALKAAGHVHHGVKGLIIEWALANLGGDLNLPVCAPRLVRLEEAALAIHPDPAWAAKAKAGNPIAFGSVYAGSEDGRAFSEWSHGYQPAGPWLDQAWHVAVFDALIDNIDRHPGNANCLTRGKEFRLIDHEKCLTQLAGVPLLGVAARKPWMLDGCSRVLGPSGHIFFRHLKGTLMPRAAIKDAWLDLPTNLARAYGDGLPPEWAEAPDLLNRIEGAVKDIQANIEGCLDEVQRCLS